MLREAKAILPLSEGKQLLVFQFVDADVYWVPLQDVTRLRYKEFVVEVVVRDPNGIERTLSRVNLLSHPEIGKDGNPPFFLGACDAGSFWATDSSRLFFVESASGNVKRIPADPQALTFGKWERLSPSSILRSNEHGVFEFTADGVQKVRSQVE